MGRLYGMGIASAHAISRTVIGLGTSRIAGTRSASLCTLSMVSSSTRAYATKRNIITDSLAYVKKVDEEQARLESEPTTGDKIDKLLESIKSNPELLYLLATFHKECSAAGITQAATRKSSLQFHWRYVSRLKPLHDSFWELCRLVEISNHRHKLRWDIRDLGLLDPQNFGKDIYSELQTGRYNDIDFRNVQTFSGSSFS